MSGQWAPGAGKLQRGLAGLAVHPRRRLFSCHHSPSPLRMLESTGEGKVPTRAPVQALPSEKPRADVFSECSGKQQPCQVSSLPAGRESRSRRVDSSRCLGSADIHQHCWALAGHTARDQHLQISLLSSAAGAEGLDDSQSLMLKRVTL